MAERDWSLRDRSAMAKLLDDASEGLSGSVFVFHGWHCDGQEFEPPETGSSPPPVFGRLKLGQIFSLNMSDNRKKAPMRHAELLIEIFMAGSAKPKLWKPALDLAIDVLSATPPPGIVIQNQAYRPPSGSDLPGIVFPNYSSVLGVVPYRAFDT